MGRLSRLRVRPGDIEAANTPADTQAPTFDAATNLFKWAAAGAAYDPFGRKHFHDMMGTTWGTSFGGTGSILSNVLLMLTLSTGTTSGSYAEVNARPAILWIKDSDIEWFIGVDAGVIWSYNGEAYLCVSATRPLPYTVGARKRYGFHLVRDATYASRILAVTCDGTTQTLTDIGAFPTAPMTLRAKYTAGVKCEFYKDGALVATHMTNLPTGAGFGWFYNGIRNLEDGDIQMTLKMVRGYADY